MRVTVNGAGRELPAGSTVADAIAALGLDRTEPGLAAAVDAAVIPRGMWSATPLHEAARLEIVRAAAGG